MRLPNKYTDKIKLRLTFLVVLLLLTAGVTAQTETEAKLIQPKVDKRTELLSIVFRLAGRPEYNNNAFKLYTDRIANHFDKWKDHELIKFSRSLIQTNGISYDAVMSMAVNMDESLNLNKDLSMLEKRWDEQKAKQFNKLLKKFAKESDFEEFYRQNDSIYREAESRFMPIYNMVDTKWFRDFYGKESSDVFHIILSMSNGGANYGTRTNGKSGERNVYSIMGAWNTDREGMVVYHESDIFSTLIHEFSHSFVAFDYEPFRESGERIHAVVGQQMARQAYGQWPIVLTEAMVRASVIKYLKDHKSSLSNIYGEIARDKMRGFYWVGKLAQEFDAYSAARSQYPTLESYLPKLVEVYPQFASYVENYDEQRPKITSIEEFKDGDTTVNNRIGNITVNFDKPLVGRGYSFNYGPLGPSVMPKITGVKYTNENKTVVIGVELKPEKEYQIMLIGNAFMTAEGDGMLPYILTFKTAQ